MQARVTRLETIAEHVERDLTDMRQTLRRHEDKLDGLRDHAERDFRLLFGALIAVALGLAGLMAKGFGWL